MKLRIGILLLFITMILCFCLYAWYRYSNEKYKQFVIVTASYNNSQWYRYNLNSIFAQTYPYYRLIYIDDCSTDDTYRLVQSYLEQNNLQSKVTLIKNEKRKGALANHYKALQMCKDNEIIVCLDGDDFFDDDDVLEYLNTVYADPDIWLTYGQFCNWPTGDLGWCVDIPQQVIDNNEFRKFGFVFVQLRTYYAWLAKLVKKEDLLLNPQDPESFFPVAGDVALMFPMLEMCGNHFCFISDILCQRNVATPINDFKINPDLQVQLVALIAAKTPYQPLKKSPLIERAFIDIFT